MVRSTAKRCAVDDLVLQLVWVAAHHGLRRWEQRGMLRPQINSCWEYVHEVTVALGNPPAPGGPR